MSIDSTIRLIESKIYRNRPVHLRWIDEVAPRVGTEFRRGQRAFWFYQIPYMATLAAALYGSRYVGVTLPGYTWSIALALAGLALLCSIPAFRLGVAAFGAVTSSPQEQRARLRWLGFSSLLLTTIFGICTAGFLLAAIGAPGVSR